MPPRKHITPFLLFLRLVSPLSLVIIFYSFIRYVPFSSFLPSAVHKNRSNPYTVKFYTDNTYNHVCQLNGFRDPSVPLDTSKWRPASSITVK